MIIVIAPQPDTVRQRQKEAVQMLLLFSQFCWDMQQYDRAVSARPDHHHHEEALPPAPCQTPLPLSYHRHLLRQQRLIFGSLSRRRRTQHVHQSRTQCLLAGDESGSDSDSESDSNFIPNTGVRWRLSTNVRCAK